MRTFAIASRLIIQLLILAIFVGGCSSVRINDYADMQPVMTPERPGTAAVGTLFAVFRVRTRKAIIVPGW